MDVRKGNCIAVLAAIVLGGCAEGERPFGPEPGADAGQRLESVQAVFECVAQVRGGAVECTATEGSPAAGVSAAIFAGQGNRILLESSNVSYDGSVFSADVTLLNLLSAPLGTTDGSTPHAAGVRVFFLSDNTVTSGEGVVTVANPSGRAMFTESDQPYFQYDAPIAPLERSDTLTWRWSVPNTVGSFTFGVAVSAEVAADFRSLAPRFDASRISVYTRHGCALTAEGVAYCWGANSAGQIGDGTTTDRPTPVPVAGGHIFASISAGFNHSCGLTTNGDAYCWGFGSSGQLGWGSPYSREEPTLVVGGHHFVSIGAGYRHSCGLTIEGKIYCWGYNEDGVLGIGVADGNSYRSPQEVATPAGKRFVSLAAHGYKHVCALTDEGEAYCWGRGNKGQLGYGSYTAKPAPEKVVGGHTFVSISVGYEHTCALTRDGDAYCWGYGYYGQLGHGGNGFTADRSLPVKVNTTLKFVSIKAGSQNTCALTAEGEAYCWGTGFNGANGNGLTDQRTKPQEPVSGGTFIEIDINYGSTACGIAIDGQAYCWGDDNDGSLGNGSSEKRLEPYPVSIFRYTQN